MDRRILLLAPLALAARGAAGQSGDSLTAASPTAPLHGSTGYQELAAAARELLSSRLFDQLSYHPNAPEGLSLAFKRRLLQDPPVARALVLARRGLSKPVSAPEGMSLGERAWALGDLVRVGYLLGVHAAVLLAGGVVDNAVETLRLALLLGRIIELGGSYPEQASATAAPAIRVLAAHLGQLSAGDCARLEAACRSLRALPDPQRRILELRRWRVMERMSLVEGDSRRHSEFLAGYPDDIDPETRAAMQPGREAVRALVAAPGGLDRLWADANRRVGAAFEAAFLDAEKPPWQREGVEIEDDGTAGGSIAAEYGGGWISTNDSTPELAVLHLFACHAAIRRFLWEHDRLPQDLDALRLGAFSIDPFTGDPLQFQRLSDRRYRLWSAGPPAGADDPLAVDGRGPFSLAPGDPPEAPPPDPGVSNAALSRTEGLCKMSAQSGGGWLSPAAASPPVRAR